MQLVVNDLSAKFPCADVRQGREIMERFIEAYYLVKDVLRTESVLFDKDYRSFELAQNYRLEQWLSDAKIDVEMKRKFRRILNQSIVFDSEEFEQEQQWRLDAEFRHGELVSKSCQLAYEIEGVLISFLSDSYWKRATVQGTYTYLDAIGDIKEVQAEVPNISCQENAIPFREEQEKILNAQQRESMHCGMDIFMCRKEAFPNLIFCDNASKQLQTAIGATEAGQVYRRLMELQKATEKKQGKFVLDELTHATPETKITLQMFEEEHTIMLPTGATQLFSWHVRFTGAYAGRIFFEPVPNEGKIYIGHIGRKLPTAKFH